MTQQHLTREFEALRGPLKSFLLRMTASVEDTEDLMQETWIRAARKIDSYRGESNLKTWIFAIAANLAKDLLRAKKRWPVNATDICKEAALGNPQFFEEALHIRSTSPQGHFEIAEHITFCFTCIGKSLPLEQQICLLLKDVYDFKIAEIATIADKSEAMIKYYLHTARARMIEIFDGRCALINKNGTCHQCTELNGIFNPKQKNREELAKIEMARAAGSADKSRLYELRTQIVQGIDPYESAAAELQLHHLTHNRKVMENYLKKNGD